MSLESKVHLTEQSAEARQLSAGKYLVRRMLRPQSYEGAVLRPLHMMRWKAVASRIGSYAMRLGRPMRVLQIGANDGIHHDPVHALIDKYDMTGVLVEPAPTQFTALQRNYRKHIANGRVRVVQAAITDHDGSVDMFVAKQNADGTVPLQGKDSLHLSVLQKHGWMIDGKLEDAVEKVRVPAMMVPTLLARAAGFTPDMIVTDTEGHDKVILDQFDLDTMELPAFWMYEHAHLPKTDVAQVDDRFRSYGYDLTKLRRDTVAELR